MTRLGDIADVVMPHLIQPAAIGFAGFGRHVVPGKGFDKRLIGADAEHMGGDVEFVECGLVVEVIEAEALQQYSTGRIEQNSIGMGR